MVGHSPLVLGNVRARAERMRLAVVEPLSAIRYLIARPAVRVPLGTSLSDAAEVMVDDNVSSLIVEPDGERLITERDLSRALAGCFGPDDPVDVVATHPIRVPADMPVVDAAAVMLNEEVRHLVVD